MRYSRNIFFFLKFVSSCSKEQRYAVLKCLNEAQLKILVEIIYNITKSVIPVSKRDKKLLRKYMHSIRRLILPALNLKSRQSILIKLEEIIPKVISLFFKYDERDDTDTT